MVETIAVSKKAYDKVMEKKQEMEREQAKMVPMKDAVDMLLGLAQV